MNFNLRKIIKNFLIGCGHGTLYTIGFCIAILLLSMMLIAALRFPYITIPTVIILGTGIANVMES